MLDLERTQVLYITERKPNSFTQLLGLCPAVLLEALTHRKIEAKTEEVKRERYVSPTHDCLTQMIALWCPLWVTNLQTQPTRP